MRRIYSRPETDMFCLGARESMLYPTSGNPLNPTPFLGENPGAGYTPGA